MRQSQSFPLTLLGLALLACTIQSQSAARPAQSSPTPSPRPAALATITPTPEPTPTPTPEPRPAVVRCAVATGTPGGWLNLRAGPGMGYQARAVLQEGQALDLLQAGAWAKVRTLAGLTGWVNSSFLECER